MKSLLFLLAAGALSVAAVASEKSRPMSEMHGDCSAYKTDLSREFSIWKENAVVIPAKSLIALQYSKKISLSLSKKGEVAFIFPPEKSFPINGPSFGGVFQLTSPKNGKLRISSESKVWFDLVDNEKKEIVQSSEFEMQTGCDKIFKAVTFQVREKSSYSLQVSSASEPNAIFIFSMD